MSQIRADIQDVLRRTHLPVLDGLRAMAVMVVIAEHAGLVPSLGGWRMYSGGMGVSGFFVLSGFLITWLLLREHDKTGRIRCATFTLGACSASGQLTMSWSTCRTSFGGI